MRGRGDLTYMFYSLSLPLSLTLSITRALTPSFCCTTTLPAQHYEYWLYAHIYDLSKSHWSREKNTSIQELLYIHQRYPLSSSGSRDVYWYVISNNYIIISSARPGYRNYALLQPVRAILGTHNLLTKLNCSTMHLYVN